MSLTNTYEKCIKKFMGINEQRSIVTTVNLCTDLPLTLGERLDAVIL